MSDTPSLALKSETTPRGISVVASRPPSNGSHLAGYVDHVDHCSGVGVTRGARSQASADRDCATQRTRHGLCSKMICNASEEMEE